VLIVKYNPNGELLWEAESTPDTVSVNNVAGIQLDDSGNVYVACEHYWYTTGKSHYDYMLIKYNSDGKYKWHRIFDISDHTEEPFDLAIDSRGNSYITGYYSYPYNTAFNYVWLTISYDRNGNLRKKLVRDLSAGDYVEYGGFVRIDHNDNVYIAGPMYSLGNYYLAIDKYDSSGTYLWEKLFDLKFNILSKFLINQNNSLIISSLDDIFYYTILNLDQDGEKKWDKKYPDDLGDIRMTENLENDSESNLYFTYIKPEKPSEFHLLKFDDAGNQFWEVSSVDSGHYQLKKMIKDTNGNTYSLGQIDNGDDDFDYAAIKYNISGIALWGTRYQGPSKSEDIPNDIVLDNAGNVYITGSSKGMGTATDFATIKYDSLGNEEWISRYNGPAYNADEAQKVRVDYSGNVYVAGNSLNAGGNYDIATVKYNSNGQFQWAKRYTGSSNGLDEVCGLEIDQEGDIYVGGTSDSIGALYDFLLIKYDPEGEIKWTRRYNGTGNDGDKAKAMTMDKDNNIYLVGWSVGDGTQSDFAVVKYSPAGNREWVGRWDDPANSSEEANAITVDGDGNVYVAGYSPGAGTDNDITTVKYNRSGEEQWFETYDGGDGMSDLAGQIALDDHGDVYVTGSVNNGEKIAVIKYNTEGVYQWAELYRYGDYQHMPVDLKVDHSGNIYLGETIYNADEGYWNIVKYEQEGFIPTGIHENSTARATQVLLQNYPNPFKVSTAISYYLPAEGYVTLTVYNMSGMRIQTLVSENEKPGEYRITFSPGHIPDGIYFVQIRMGEKRIETQKMILLQ
jgi:uncharacterized delta-60 repeat protein